MSLGLRTTGHARLHQGGWLLSRTEEFRVAWTHHGVVEFVLVHFTLNQLLSVFNVLQQA